ncbi:hypothetical protein BRC83_07660 [Halobacteriales archaeon QS_1_68_17]|nr:MAG: hypothetical protein BRC83_07660 [Halobacteriales archaeon QS_1_68_17]
MISVLAVAGFVGLNLVGARATGSAENLLVGTKVLVLGVFGIGGLVYAVYGVPEPVAFGTGRFASFGPIMAAFTAYGSLSAITSFASLASSLRGRIRGRRRFRSPGLSSSRS